MRVGLGLSGWPIYGHVEQDGVDVPGVECRVHGLQEILPFHGVHATQPARPWHHNAGGDDHDPQAVGDESYGDDASIERGPRCFHALLAQSETSGDSPPPLLVERMPGDYRNGTWVMTPVTAAPLDGVTRTVIRRRRVLRCNERPRPVSV
jgi:hypothetical protein